MLSGLASIRSVQQHEYPDFSRSFRNKADYIPVKKTELEKEELWTLSAKKMIAMAW